MGHRTEFGIRRAIVISLGLPALIGVLVLILWVNDVRQDRKHTVTINSPTPIFIGRGGEDCENKPQIATAQSGSTIRIRRIRYWKNCATLDVVLPDGRKGYIVLGIGSASIDPPLHEP